MKAIDELRGFLSESPSVVFPDEVSEYVDAIERELEERYVELPVDGDGVPIHIGDKVTQVSDRPTPVLGITYHKSTPPSICIERGDLWIDADTLHHYKSPTVEDILREFADLVREEQVERAQISDEAIAEFAERLQLKEGE